MRSVLAALALLLLCLRAPAFGLTVLSYNVENLFDDVDNGTEFPEFDPSRGRWNSDLFHMRVETIAEVIRKSAAGGPDILLLQEVENENALRVLVDTGLRGMGYRFFVLLPKKNLAANVALVSRFPIEHVRSHAVRPWRKNPVRDVVEAQIRCPGGVLHVFDDHWKSKAGGAERTEGSRLESAAVVVRRVRSILSEDPQADIVVAGDMNENLDEFDRVRGRYQTALVPAAERTPPAFAGSSIFVTGNPAELAAPGGRVLLYDPWYEIPAGRRGSYVYHGDWETTDHMLLSAGLFDSRGLRYRLGGFTVVRLPFLLRKDGSPRKWTLSGGRGYSDHLPLLLKLEENGAR